MIVQFVCRGNAFRSVIADAYLQSLQVPGVTVYSSGTVAGLDREENAPNFAETRTQLVAHGLEAFVKADYGQDLSQELLNKSDIAIFMNQRAHDEAAAKFQLPERTYVWDVMDMGETGAPLNTKAEKDAYREQVYQQIKQKVDALVPELTAA